MCLKSFLSMVVMVAMITLVALLVALDPTRVEVVCGCGGEIITITPTHNSDLWINRVLLPDIALAGIILTLFLTVTYVAWITLKGMIFVIREEYILWRLHREKN